MKTGRLLLLENEPGTLRLLAFLLSEKHLVHLEIFGGRVVAAVKQVKPELIVADVGILPAKAVRCLQEIRAIREYSTIPTIALRPSGSSLEKQDFLSAGFQAVFTKPILDRQTVFDIVESLLSAAASEKSWPDRKST